MRKMISISFVSPLLFMIDTSTFSELIDRGSGLI
jgi:hypothetical protein